MRFPIPLTNGVAGSIVGFDKRSPGQGLHATLSPFDMHATLIAAGPDFTRGFASDLPSGNVDVAPTILYILGVTPAQPLDGRILMESFPGGAHAGPKAVTNALKAARDLGGRVWSQYLSIASVGNTEYIDEGGGHAASK